LKPSWVTKTDPEKHPVRSLASVWQQQMKANFGLAERPMTSKEFGQLKALRLHWGDLTREVVEWIVDSVNWWHFCQGVRAAWKTIFVPEYPDIGFLLSRRGVALKVMRSKLSDSTTGAEFVKKIDEKEFQQIKNLLLAAYVQGSAERLSKIETARTLEDIQKIFNGMVGASTSKSLTEVPLVKNSA
jgi:hypothetical protein